jgi:hypothetical protein
MAIQVAVEALRRLIREDKLREGKAGGQDDE